MLSARRQKNTDEGMSIREKSEASRRGIWRTEKGIHLLFLEAQIGWAATLCQAVYQARQGVGGGGAVISKTRLCPAFVEFSVYWGRHISMK